MKTYYCESCGRHTGFKRALGWGTFFMVLLTLGLWLLIIPLYPTRCSICGTTKFGKAGLVSVVGVLIALALVGVFIDDLVIRARHAPVPIVYPAPKARRSMSAVATPNYVAKPDYSDAIQVSPEQLKTFPRSYLHRKVGIIGATVTRLDTPKTFAEEFGVNPPSGCQLIAHLNGFIMACAERDQAEVFNKYWIGKDVGMACVVGAVSEPVLIVDHCIFIPSFYDVVPQQ